jgi:hypothetical protein
MVVLLTDLFDCKELPWRYKTKHSGSNEIHSVYLNLQAATTPESIASCLPSSAIGGGLTSRVLWIWADRRSKKCSRPEENAEMKVLESKLINDLAVIARIQGTYQFTDDSGNRWDAWYNNYEELDVKRICKDPSFNGWYSRKPTYILKVAQLLAAVESDSLVMEWRFIQEAIKLVEETEENMGGVFRAVGKSVISSEVDMVMQLIKKNQAISEEKLMSIIWKDADAAKFDAIIQTCLRTGQIKRDFHDPEGNMHKEIWNYETNYFKSVARKWVKPEALKLADREDGNVKSVEGSA